MECYYHIYNLATVNIESLKSAINKFNQAIEISPSKCIRGEFFRTGADQRNQLNVSSKESKRFMQVDILSSIIAIRHLSLYDLWYEEILEDEFDYDDYHYAYIKIDFDFIYDTKISDVYNIEAIKANPKHILRPRIMGIRKDRKLFIDKIITFDYILFLAFSKNDKYKKRQELFEAGLKC